MNYKRKTIKVITSLLAVTAIGGATLSPVATYAWGWPFHSQEEIDTLNNSNLDTLDACSEKVKKLNSVDSAKNFLDTIEKLRAENDGSQSKYSNLSSVSKKVKELSNLIDTTLTLQDIEQRDKINNAKVCLEENLKRVLANASKNVSEKSNLDKILESGEDIRSKINMMDNVGRVSGLEVLISNLSDDIADIIKLEEKQREGAIKRSIAEYKARFVKILEKLIEEKENIDSKNAALVEISDKFSRIESAIKSADSMEKISTVEKELNSLSSQIESIISEQIRVEEENKKLRELEKNIDNQRDFSKQLELLREGKIKLDDVIGGNNKAKSKAESLVKAYERFRSGGKIKPSKGILFYGPPGTGKTTFVESFAAANDMEIISIVPSMLMDSDGPHKAVQIIDSAKKCAQISGKLTILHIDEIDAIAQIRSSSSSDKVLVVIMNALDKIDPKDGVIVFATTNRREALDPAIVRTGRIDQAVEIGTPNHDDKIEILNIRLKNLKLAKDINFDNIVDKMKGFSGADIGRVVDIAIDTAMDREKSDMLSKITIKKSDLENGIITVTDERV